MPKYCYNLSQTNQKTRVIDRNWGRSVKEYRELLRIKQISKRCYAAHEEFSKPFDPTPKVIPPK